MSIAVVLALIVPAGAAAYVLGERFLKKEAKHQNLCAMAAFVILVIGAFWGG